MKTLSLSGPNGNVCLSCATFGFSEKHGQLHFGVRFTHQRVERAVDEFWQVEDRTFFTVVTGDLVPEAFAILLERFSCELVEVKRRMHRAQVGHVAVSYTHLTLPTTERV